MIRIFYKVVPCNYRNHLFVGGRQAEERGGYVVLHRSSQRNAAECKFRTFAVETSSTLSFNDCSICVLQMHRIQKCLQKLLRALHKDRHHTIAHYKHLLDSSLEQAQREKPATLEHLAEIDRITNQSLLMLER